MLMKRAPVLIGLMVMASVAGCRRAPATPSSAAAPAVGSPGQSPQASASGQPSQTAQAPGPGQAAEAAKPAEPVKPVPAQLPPVVAKVNGESIERWELESVAKQAEARAGSPIPPEQRDAVLRDLLDDLVSYHLLAQESRARKIAVTEADVDAQLKTIRQGFPTDEAFQQAVAARGLTMDRLRQQERRNLQARKLIDQEVTSKITIADADVDAFYKGNIEKFKQGDTYHVSHIFIGAAANADGATKLKARARADQTLKDLRAGADFAQIAKDRSDDTTATDGGDLGFVGKGDLPPDFEKVMLALKPGEMSDVVELGAGFHIIKLHEKRAPRTVPLEEVRADVKAFLTQSQQKAKLDQFMGETKAKSKIEVLV
jgi:parvulin-like peptidyl-prolyl isomerase